MRLFTDVASTIPNAFLRRAFVLAEEGRGTTSPNPLVGCVIAQDDEIVGEGFHERAGGPHAEAVALAQAGPRAAGATAYVTLEPCNHFGRTPPCSEALISRGIARVVIGMADPNPVAVGGHVRLREAGLEVGFEPDPTPYEIQNEAWLKRVRTGRPFVRAKVALTLDGHATLQDETRSALTGPGGREVAMALRAAADAVIVGADTARIDDPRLTVRAAGGEPAAHQPARGVWGRAGVPAATFFGDGLGPTFALLPLSAASLPGSVPEGVDVVAYSDADDVGSALDALGERGLTSILVEPGPRLLDALLEADAVDELVFLHAGGFAGPKAPPLRPGGEGADPAALVCDWTALEAGVSGDDAVTVWRRRRDKTS